MWWRARIRRGRVRAAGTAWLIAASVVPGRVLGQTPADLAQERAEFARWLSSAPVSPLAAVAVQPIGRGLRLGPADADIPLAGVAEHRVVQQGGLITLEGPSGRRSLRRGIAVRLGDYTLLADGPAGRAALTVFGSRTHRLAVRYFDYRADLVFEGPLEPPPARVATRVLGLDGVEVDAAEAGSVLVPVGGRPARLRVRRFPGSGGEESELEIYFQDGTNGHGSYPAGRFVSLVPVSPGRFRLDFNRARNRSAHTARRIPARHPGTATR
jgi:uncharacterized protein (DUF1684 family)